MNLLGLSNGPCPNDPSEEDGADRLGEREAREHRHDVDGAERREEDDGEGDDNKAGGFFCAGDLLAALFLHSRFG